MGKETGISWCDHTFNPWWGCTKVSLGCANCYAEAFDKRVGGDHFGPGKKRRYFPGEKHWTEPLKWNRAAEKAGVRRKVFCGSMCDWLDKQASPAYRLDLLTLIRRTQWLNWLLLTKRAESLSCLKGYLATFNNIWLGVTVESGEQKHRVDELRTIPATVRFLSCEPLLGPLGDLDLTGIHWVIVGGESGPNARPMDPLWALDIQRQCYEQGVAFFFKQHGGKDRNKGGCLWGGQEVKEFPGAEVGHS